MTMLDKRRRDERDNIRGNPFWMSSAVFNFDDGAGMDDNETVLFHFDKASFWVIDQAVLEIEIGFAPTPVMLIGHGTIANVDVTDGATVSVVDADALMTDALSIPETPGSKVVTEVNLATANLTFKGAAATVPVIYITFTSGGTVTAGRGRLHMRVCEIDENIL